MTGTSPLPGRRTMVMPWVAASASITRSRCPITPTAPDNKRSENGPLLFPVFELTEATKGCEGKMLSNLNVMGKR